MRLTLKLCCSWMAAVAALAAFPAAGVAAEQFWHDSGGTILAKSKMDDPTGVGDNVSFRLQFMQNAEIVGKAGGVGFIVRCTESDVGGSLERNNGTLATQMIWVPGFFHCQDVAAGGQPLVTVRADPGQLTWINTLEFEWTGIRIAATWETMPKKTCVFNNHANNTFTGNWGNGASSSTLNFIADKLGVVSGPCDAANPIPDLTARYETYRTTGIGGRRVWVK